MKKGSFVLLLVLIGIWWKVKVPYSDVSHAVINNLPKPISHQQVEKVQIKRRQKIIKTEGECGFISYAKQHCSEVDNWPACLWEKRMHFPTKCQILIKKRLQWVLVKQNISACHNDFNVLCDGKLSPLCLLLAQDQVSSKCIKQLTPATTMKFIINQEGRCMFTFFKENNCSIVEGSRLDCLLRYRKYFPVQCQALLLQRKQWRDNRSLFSLCQADSKHLCSYVADREHDWALECLLQQKQNLSANCQKSLQINRKQLNQYIHQNPLVRFIKEFCKINTYEDRFRCLWDNRFFLDALNRRQLELRLEWKKRSVLCKHDLLQFCPAESKTEDGGLFCLFKQRKQISSQCLDSFIDLFPISSKVNHLSDHYWQPNPTQHRRF